MSEDKVDVRAVRQRLGMTQEQFAHHIGVTVGTVNRWENKRFRPSRLARVVIAQVAAKAPTTATSQD